MDVDPPAAVPEQEESGDELDELPAADRKDGGDEESENDTNETDSDRGEFYFYIPTSDEDENEDDDEYKELWFTVEHPSGEKAMFYKDEDGEPLEEVETVGDLKAFLEKEWSIPASRQALYRKGKELKKDHRLISKYGIHEDALVTLSRKVLTRIDVQPPQRSIAAICASISVLRAEVRKRRRSNAYVEWLRRDQFDDFDRELHALSPSSSLPFHSIPIAVWESEEADGPCLQLAIKPTDSVADVKKRSYGRLGFDFDDCELLYEGKPLPNETTMSDFDLADQTPTFRFKCLDEHEDRTVEPTDTAASLQAELDAVREELKAVPPPPPSHLQQWNEEVDVLTKCVEDMEAYAGHKRFQLFVKMLNGKTITILVHSLCTVEQLKQKIADKSGGPVEHQYLTYGGKVLQDQWTLEDYAIGKEATIYLTFHMRGSALINYTDCQQVPEHADFAFVPFDVVLAHRKFEHDFSLLMRRVDEMRALVHSKVDQPLVREALREGHKEIALRRLQHVREQKKRKRCPPFLVQSAPPLEAEPLVRHWQRSMVQLKQEVDITKRSVQETNAEIAEVERELERLRGQLKRRASDEQ